MLGLGIVVEAVVQNGLAAAAARLILAGSSLPSLLALAGLAALLADRGHHTDLGEFTRLGLLTVPAGLVLVTEALWAVLRI